MNGAFDLKRVPCQLTRRLFLPISETHFFWIHTVKPMCCPFTTHHSLLTIHYSLLTIHHSPFTTHHSINFLRALNKKAPLSDASVCGPRGIRTLDLLNAIETRSQLRYGPSHPVPLCAGLRGTKVDLEGFEPSTSSVRLRRAPNCATGPS